MDVSSLKNSRVLQPHHYHASLRRPHSVIQIAYLGREAALPPAIISSFHNELCFTHSATYSSFSSLQMVN